MRPEGLKLLLVEFGMGYRSLRICPSVHRGYIERSGQGAQGADRAQQHNLPGGKVCVWARGES
jgi:hypothetical protein